MKTVTEESDVRVTISSDLKSTKHCKSACKRANTMLGVIANNLEYKTPEIMMSFYNSYGETTLGIRSSVLFPGL